MTFSCKLCGSTQHDQHTVTDAKSRENLSISMCRTCMMVQQTILPSDDDLKIYYSHHYRTDYKSTYTPKLKYVQRAGNAALHRLAFMAAHVRPPAHARLIDIGAGGGEFVYHASRAGFAAYGIEPNLGYSEFARSEYGIDVKTMMLDEMPQAGADIVTMFHVLEHMANPHAVFEKIFQTLGEGGLLFIEVPNILQNDASPHNIFFKAHLLYYSSDTLAAMASPYFDVVVMEDQGNLRAIFRRRNAIGSLVLPSQERVAHARTRMKQKGWLEYLFAGRGILKPFRRIAQRGREAAIQVASPRALLESQWAAQPVRFD